MKVDSAVPPHQVTVLLHAWRGGKADALNELMAIVYPQLRALAWRCMNSENPGHTLGATGLVHEAYLRIAGAETPWEDRVHFFAILARVMRHILVDHGKAKRRLKRGGDGVKVDLDETVAAVREPEDQILDLDEALRNLSQIDKRKADLVELIYFGGLTQSDAAKVMNISAATVERDLRMAKAWLYRALQKNTAAAGK